jgi:hypothetical protein
VEPTAFTDRQLLGLVLVLIAAPMLLLALPVHSIGGPVPWLAPFMLFGRVLDVAAVTWLVGHRRDSLLR